jgi:hypothetical protein
MPQSSVVDLLDTVHPSAQGAIPQIRVGTIKIIAAIILGCCVTGTAVAKDGPYEKDVGTDWKWFTDYAYWSSDWTLNVQAGCDVEVGFGVMAFGNPLGGRRQFKTYYQLRLYGVGAIHVRVVNGTSPCRVRLDIGNVSPIPVYGNPSVVKGAVSDVEKAVEAARQRSENQIPNRN